MRCCRALAAWGGVRCLVFVLMLSGLAACSKKETDPRSLLVGGWQSSRLSTPLFLYDNGEWEIKTADGAVLQYGVWQYKDQRIIWTHQVGTTLSHDVNAVIDLQAARFALREADQSITTFTRLAPP